MNKDQLLIKYRTELMGIASLGVILCHAVVADVKLPNVIIKVLVYGNLGVDMFLLMSGIGMYYSLNQTKYICHWYKKRAMRLLLPYFIVMLPYWVIYSLLNRQGVLGFLHYFSTLSFWTEHIGAWYVAMLIPFYLMLPYIFCLWRKSPVLITVILTSVSIILGAYPLEDSDLHMQVFSNAQFCIKRLPAFWVGLLFGYCSECSPRFDLKSMRGGYQYLLIALISFIIYFVFNNLPYISLCCWYFLPAISISFVSVFLLDKCKHANRIGIILRWIGNRSLESYLCNYVCVFALGAIPYVFWGFDLSYGNYIYYVLVIVIGIILTFLSGKVKDRIVNHFTLK